MHVQFQISGKQEDRIEPKEGPISGKKIAQSPEKDHTHCIFRREKDFIHGDEIALGIEQMLSRIHHSGFAAPRQVINRAFRKPGRIRVLPAAVATIALAFCACGPADAQEAQPQRGLRIVGVSVSETYFTQAVPDGIVAYGDVFLGTALSVSGAASISWTRTGTKSFMAVHVLPSYGSRFGDASSKSWNQSADFTFNRKIGSKWMLGFGGAGQVMNFDDSLFAVSNLSRVASSGATFDQLSSAILQGNSTDPLLNSAAYGSLTPNKNAQSFLFGRRTASANGQATLTYSPSARLAINFVGASTLVRHLTDKSDPADFVYPQVTSTSGGMNLTYSLSPRTQVGAAVNITQSKTLGQNSSARSFSGTVSRTMSRRWFVQGSLGAGSNNTGAATHFDGKYSAGVGFKTFSHTALFAIDRTMDDPYALALGALQHVTSLTATWHYGQLGNPWSVDSMYTQLLPVYKGVPGTNTWTVTETLTRRLGRNYAVLVQYTMGRVGAKRYIQDGRQYQLEQSGIRTTFSWSPSAGSRL